MNPQNQINDPVGFAAGTSVHTEHGLKPIEQVRVGTRVLAQPENAGPLDYKLVLNKKMHDAQPLWAVRVLVVGEEFLTTILATSHQRFWVEPSANTNSWVRVESLEPGFKVQLANGDRCIVHMAGIVRHTKYDGYGYAADHRVVMGTPGVVLNLLGEKIELATGPTSILILKDHDANTLKLYKPHLATIYQLEIESFRTCYVGDTGVWVYSDDAN